MGTTFRLVFYTSGDSLAKDAARNAFDNIEALDAALSDYKKESELNRLSRKSGSEKWIPVSSLMYEVLSKSQQVSTETNGAFDITVGPYVKLWRKLQRSDDPELPSPDTLSELAKSVGYQLINVHKNRRAVQLLGPDMQLDLGAIAKGFAADKALQVLQNHEINSAFVDAGGDITLGDAPPGENGWNIGIQYHQTNGKHSTTVLELANKAIATSGDLYQHVDIKGKQYSHIVNPKTGLGLTNQITVTVIAPNGTTADSYASAVSVLGPEKGIALLENQPNLKGLIEYREEGKIKRITSQDVKIISSEK